jgi:hypothetical protein
VLPNLQLIKNSFTRKGDFFMPTNILDQFFNFLKSPQKSLLSIDLKQDKTSIKTKFWSVLQLLSIIIGISFILVNISSYLANLVGFNQTANNMVVDFLNQYPIWVAILMISVVGPLTEEIGFRLFLSKDKNWFFLGLAAFGYFFIQFIFDLLFDLENPTTFVSLGFFIILLGYFIFLIILNFQVPAKVFDKFITTKFTYLFWFSILSFGLLHITNYLGFWRYFYLIPLLVSPQLIAGIFLGFTRVKFGFWWCFLLHAFFNFILGLAIFADPNQPLYTTIVSVIYIGLIAVFVITILKYIFFKLKIEVVE